jgi:hypothetical protein
MQLELEKRITNVTKDKTKIIIEETGVEPSLSIDEAKQYLYDVLEEVRIEEKVG